MENTGGYHRDIFSGMVATELAKNGYFGDEYRLYGFLYWLNSEKKLITNEKKEECAKIYVELIEQGALATPYISYGERVNEPQKKEKTMISLKEKIYDSLDQKYGNDLNDNITMYKQKAINSTAVNILRDYYLSLEASSAMREKVQSLKWLAGHCKKRRLISHESYNYFLGLLPKTESDIGEHFKELSGFAWYTDNGWKYYTNAFLPTVVDKVIQLHRDGYLTSGIVSKKYQMSNKTIYELKVAFQEYLGTVLDTEYLSVVQKLDKMN